MNIKQGTSKNTDSTLSIDMDMTINAERCCVVLFSPLVAWISAVYPCFSHLPTKPWAQLYGRQRMAKQLTIAERYPFARENPARTLQRYSFFHLLSVCSYSPAEPIGHSSGTHTPIALKYTALRPIEGPCDSPRPIRIFPMPPLLCISLSTYIILLLTPPSHQTILFLPALHATYF